MSFTDSKLTREEQFLLERIRDMHARAAWQDIATYTPFFAPHLLDFLKPLFGPSAVRTEVIAVPSGAERIMLAFIPDWLDWSPSEAPARILRVKGEGIDQLSHRDVLGSLMALGIRRDQIGEILIGEGGVFVVAAAVMEDFLIAELRQIGRAEVLLEPVQTEELLEADAGGEPITITVASLRLDLLVARAFSLSREATQQLFTQGRIKRNHRVQESYKREAAEGDLISVRGYGRIRIDAVGKTTRKGNLILHATRFR